MMKRLILILFLIPNFTNAAVIINEVAWMGSNNGGTATENANDEWIELYNNGSGDIDLTGWILSIKDKKDIILQKVLSANNFYLLERTDDNSVPNIPADLIYTGALSNTGEILILKNNNIEVDKIDASAGWPAGDNTSKQTMQRTPDNKWITADPTPRAQNASSQSSSQSQATSTAVDQEPISDVGSVSWPVEPQIYANAGKDKTVIVGADVYFSGQALGIEKEPLENARYLWNFGDGAIAENQNVKHIYQYPGEYIVVLDVSSGKYSTSDNLLVKVIPNQLKISEVNKDFIKLSNESNVTLDVSGWFLRMGPPAGEAGDKTFKFPDSTLIKANSTLIIPSSNSGLEMNNSNSAELLYSNGSKAFSWQKSFVPATVVVSDLKNEAVIKEQAQENTSISQDQVADVISVTKESFWTTGKWVGLIILIGVLSSAGFLFVRHKYEKI